MMVPCKIEIFKKIDVNNIFTGYEDTPYTFTRLIENVKIDRRLSSNVATANVDIFYAGFNEDLILYQYGGSGAKIPIIDNFNRIKIYIDDKIQFYGIIMNYIIDDEKAMVSISCQDMFYRLNRLVDCRVPFIEYSNIMVYDLMSSLAARAGIPSTVIKSERGDNYHISDIKIKYDTQISDVFSDATATSNTRVRCLKNGDFAIEDMYHTYEYSDVPNNVNYDYMYTYTKRVISSNARRGGDTLYNRLLIRFNDKTYNVYDNPVLFNYMCGENRFKEIQTTLGDTIDKRTRLANRTFRNDTRENTTLTLDAVDGNPDLDLGQALRVNLDNRIGHYMVTGISTSYSADGYFDNIDIEGLLPTDYISCDLGVGNYDGTDAGNDTTSNAHFVDIKANVAGPPIIIKKGKACKVGKFQITKTTPNPIIIKCEVDNPYAGPSIMTPAMFIWGLEGSKGGASEPLTHEHGPVTVTDDLKTFSNMTFTTYPGTIQQITINDPMEGTWLIRVVGLPSEDVGCTITCNVDWTLLNEEADPMGASAPSTGGGP